MKIYSYISGLVGLALITTSCKTDFYEDPTPAIQQTGSANFSKYIAVGSGITAGFMDGTLYTEGQNSAYPALIAARVKEIDPTFNFNQPTVNAANGFSRINGNVTEGRFLLTVPSCASQGLARVAQPGEALSPYTGNKASLNNLGIPNLRINQLHTALTGGTNAATNPRVFYDRIVSVPGSTTIADEAKQKGATFFTLWVGYTDALAYATSGGTTTLPTPAQFQADFEKVLDNLLASGASGVVGNIPDVAEWPAVTNNNRRLANASDPIGNPFTLTEDEAAAFNKAHTDLGYANPGFKIGRVNAFAIQTGTGAIRQLKTSEDFVVLSRANLDSLGKGSINYECANGNRTFLGLRKPIPNSGVLDKDEITTLRNTITEYNSIITKVVEARNSSGKKIGIVDLYTFYKKLNDPNQGISYQSTIIRGSHPSLGPDFGGFYSLDRIHPNPKGQALIANEFIKVINRTFNATLHLYDPDQFRANSIPAQ